MYAKDLKVGALYEPCVSYTRFTVRGKYLRTVRGRRSGSRFLIYLGEADPAAAWTPRADYFWVLVGNEKCLMNHRRLTEIKPVEET